MPAIRGVGKGESGRIVARRHFLDIPDLVAVTFSCPDEIRTVSVRPGEPPVKKLAAARFVSKPLVDPLTLE